MIQSADLVSCFQRMLDEKWGYIYGASGQVWTEAKQKDATRDTTVWYGRRWIGRMVTDCSGAFVWAYKQLGETIYHGSNTIWKKHCASQGKLSGGKRADGQSMKFGTAVFLLKDGCRHHIGLYVGNDVVIEAKSTYYGVVTSHLSHWDEWGELAKVDYTDADEDGGGYVILKRGSNGEVVKLAQVNYYPENGHGFWLGNS